jgi:hypothetical protein
MDFDFDMDTEDDFSLPFDWKSDHGQDAADSETPPQVNKEEPRTVRRSRITRFPGKKMIGAAFSILARGLLCIACKHTADGIE